MEENQKLFKELVNNYGKIVFGKRESVRPSKHCRYDVPTARKFHPTFEDEKDENEEYH
jgi:hypothetical protein